MLITCPACQASYEIPGHLLVNTPVRMRCARCGAEWAWMGAKGPAEENFELPDLFAAGPLPQAVPVPPHDPVISLELPDRPELAIMPGRDVPGRDMPGKDMLGTDVPGMDMRGPEPVREPIGSPVFRPSSEPSLPPPAIEPPPRRDSMIEIPQIPASTALPARIAPNLGQPDLGQPDLGQPDLGKDNASEQALGREAMFRRIIEANRQRGLLPQASSNRPKLIAIVALIVLIALFLGVHFVMVNGVTAAPAG